MKKQSNKLQRTLLGIALFSFSIVLAQSFEGCKKDETQNYLTVEPRKIDILQTGGWLLLRLEQTALSHFIGMQEIWAKIPQLYLTGKIILFLTNKHWMH